MIDSSDDDDDDDFGDIYITTQHKQYTKFINSIESKYKIKVPPIEELKKR